MSLRETLRAKDGWAAALRLVALRGGLLGGVAALVGGAEGGVVLTLSVFLGVALAFGAPSLVESWARQRAWHPAWGAALTYPVALVALLGGGAQAEYARRAMERGTVDSAKTAGEVLAGLLTFLETPAAGFLVLLSLTFAALAGLRLAQVRARWGGYLGGVGALFLSVTLVMLESSGRAALAPVWVRDLVGASAGGFLALAGLSFCFFVVDVVERRLAIEPHPQSELPQRRSRPGLVAAVVLALLAASAGLLAAGSIYAQARREAEEERWRGSLVTSVPTMLTSLDPYERQLAAFYVRTYPELDHLLPALGPLLTDPVADVREVTLTTLRERPGGAEIAQQGLNQALASDDEQLRRWAEKELREETLHEQEPRRGAAADDR